MTLKTKPFNIQDWLKTPKDRREYLQAARMSGDAESIADAIRDIAEARRQANIRSRQQSSALRLRESKLCLTRLALANSH